MASASDATQPGLPPSFERPTKRRWVIFALAAGTSFILYLHRYTWVLIRSDIKDEFGLSNTEVDSLYTFFNVTYAMGQIPGGIICDLFGPHLFLGLIIGVWSLTLPMIGLGNSMTGLTFARMGFGVAQAGCYPSLAKVSREWFPPAKRTTLQALVASFFGRSGGAVSSIVLGTVLMGYCGLTWRWSLVVLSGIGMVYAVIFVKLCRNRPSEDPQVNEAELAIIRGTPQPATDTPSGKGNMLSAGRALKNRSLLMFVVQQYMNAGADYVYSGIMGSYFIEARSVEDKVILGLLVSMPLWGGAVGGIVGGIMNDVLIVVTGSRRWARTIVGFAGKTIACGFLFLSISHPDPMAGAWLLFVTKFFSDWTQPTVWGASTDLGGRYSATVFSIINSSGSVGGFVTPVLGGLLLDRFATTQMVGDVEQTITNFTPVFIMVGVMYFASALCWLFINCENTLDQPDETTEPASQAE